MANKKVDKITVDWNQIDTELDSGRVRLADHATTHSVSIPTMRKVFADHYGLRVVFKRGRTGGVFWASQDSAPSGVESTAPAVEEKTETHELVEA